MSSAVVAQDSANGRVVVSFDGQVFEVFFESSMCTRIHVAMMVLELDEPDRKGLVRVDVAPVKAGRGGVRFVLDAENLRLLMPVFDALRLALSR